MGVDENSKTMSFTYTDSVGVTEVFNYHDDEFENLMEMILYFGLEEWGDCGGQAKCGTCHVSIEFERINFYTADSREINLISELHNQSSKSRLACQVYLKSDLNRARVKYLGVD